MSGKAAREVKGVIHHLAICERCGHIGVTAHKPGSRTCRQLKRLGFAHCGGRINVHKIAVYP